MKKLIIQFIAIVFLISISITNGKTQYGWTIKSQLPTPRYGVCSGKLGNDIYVIGGVRFEDDRLSKNLANSGSSLDDNEVFDIVERYNPVSGNWDTDVDELDKKRYNATAVGFNGLLYVIGGKDDSDDDDGDGGDSSDDDDDDLVDEIEVFSGSGEWETASHHLCHLREGAASVVFHGKIYVIGGYGSNGEYLNSVDIYDPQQGKWEQSAHSLNVPRTSLAAVVVGENIYALGGLWHGPLFVVEKYTLGIGWQAITDMVTARGNFAACVIDSTIYVMGGQGQSGILSSTEAYKPATDEWTLKESLNSPREGFTAQVVDNKIYVLGGSNSSQRFISDVEEYTPKPSAVEVVDVSVPGHFTLYQNYPNPFNNQTVLKFQIAAENFNQANLRVNLTIYNVQGQEVITLIDEFQQPGSYQASWDGKDAAGLEQTSGIYFCTLKSGNYIKTVKLILAR